MGEGGYIVHRAAVLMMRAGHTWASVVGSHMRPVDRHRPVSLIGHTGCLRPLGPMGTWPERVDSSCVGAGVCEEVDQGWRMCPTPKHCCDSFIIISGDFFRHNKCVIPELNDTKESSVSR